MKGFARVYEEGKFTKKQLYFEIEEKARENYIGLWKNRMNQNK